MIWLLAILIAVGVSLSAGVTSVAVATIVAWTAALLNPAGTVCWLVAGASFSALLRGVSGLRSWGAVFDGAAVCALLSYAGQRLRLPRLNTLDLLSMVLILATLVEIANPNVPSIVFGLDGFRTFGFQVSGYFVGRLLLEEPRRARQFMVGSGVGIVIAGVWAIRQYFYPLPVDLSIIHSAGSSPITFTATHTGHLRAFSPLAGPFQLGVLAIIGALLATSEELSEHRTLRVLLGAISLIALLLSGTRANWLGALVAFGVYNVLVAKRPQLVAVRITAAACVVTALLVAVALLPQLGAIRVLIRTLADPLATSSMILRLQGWRDTIIPAILANPWLGYGTGMGKDGLGPYTTHSIYLKLLIETGVFGLITFVCLMMTLAVRAVRHSDTRKQNAWILASLAGVLASGLTGPMLDAYPANYVLWVLLGIAVNRSQASRQPVGGALA